MLFKCVPRVELLLVPDGIPFLKNNAWVPQLKIQEKLNQIHIGPMQISEGQELRYRLITGRLGPKAEDIEKTHNTMVNACYLDRKVVHSWHQDSGISSNTVILGFPPRDRVEASAPIGGVFSHQIKLSHPLRPNVGDAHGSIVEFERFEPQPAKVPDEYVWRPLYSRGREIFVSDDAAHMHSTPDVQRRECLWRFM